jgi:tetratricopeptide (TPR) repeat protein
MRAAPLLLLAAGCAYYATEHEEADARWRQARVELARGGSAVRALDLLDRAIELDPDRPEFYQSRAGVRRDLGRLEGAVSDFSFALDLRRASGSEPRELAELHLARGALNGDLGFAADAEKDFERALELQPGLVEVWLQRALVREKAGKAELAKDDRAEARLHGKSFHAPLHNEGIRHLKDGRLDLAERYFRFAIEVDRSRPESHVALGRVYMQARRLEEAAAAFDAALALRPDDPDLIYHRGSVRLAQGRPEAALEDFTRAQRLAPSRAAYVTARALVLHEHFRDPVRAEIEYSGAIRLDGNDPAAWFNRALLREELGRLEEAETDFRSALALRASPEAALRLAGVLRARKQYLSAVDVCLKALAICTDPAQSAALEDERRKNMDALRGLETSK